MHYVDAKGILSAQNGMNLYRGCTHGCIYCDSRSKCYGFTHDFEDIEVKRNAPALLRAALRAKRRRCMIGTGSMCDPYLHLEETEQLTRQCLEIITAEGFGLSILTKSTRILRDLDLLKQIHAKSKCVVQMTLTTYDEQLCRILEPNVSTTRERIEALKIFRDNGIPTIVWLTPILPFLNDTEENIRSLLDACIEAKVWGVLSFEMGLTLREGNREYFYAALDRHLAGMKEKYQRTFGNAYGCISPNAPKLMQILHETCAANGIVSDTNEIFAYLQEFSSNETQLTLL